MLPQPMSFPSSVSSDQTWNSVLTRGDTGERGEYDAVVVKGMTLTMVKECLRTGHGSCLGGLVVSEE